MAAEEALTGGNTSVVVRVDDTVRRPVGHWTPAVHDLLAHLAATGFPGSPRVLGTDDRGREVLEYVEGEVGTLSAEQPLPPWFRTEEACRSIGRWIRDFQAAQQGFVPDPTKPWRLVPGSNLGPDQVLVHHDVSPYNTVRTADGSVIVLDWDFVRPGDPIEDLAWAAWMWVPLRAGSWWHTEYGVTAEAAARRQQRNLRALLDGYRLDGYRPDGDAETFPRERLATAIADQMTRHADDLENLARTDPAFADLVARDFAVAAREDADWWANSELRVTF